MSYYVGVDSDAIPKIAKGATAKGAANANKPIFTDANGDLPADFRQTANTIQAQATTAIPANSFVRIYEQDGVAKVEVALALPGRLANGYVKAAAAFGETALVFPTGTFHEGLAALEPGEYYLSAGAPGQPVLLAPQATEFLHPFTLGSGNVIQRLGTATGSSFLVGFETRFKV